MGWGVRTVSGRRLWRDLADWWDATPAATSNPYLNSKILDLLADAYLQDEQALVVPLLLRDGEPVAAVPMCRDNGGHLRSLSGDLMAPLDVVMSEGEEVEARVSDWLDSFAVAHFYHVDESSAVATEFLRRERWILRKVMVSPYIPLAEGMSGVHSVLSSKSISTLRRKRRRLQELGELRFVDHVGGGEVASVVSAGLALEAAGWKGERGESVLQRPRWERFFRALSEVAEDRGWLRLSVLSLDDRMIAFQYDLAYGGRRFLKITAYDESQEFRKYSPGTLLLESVLEQSCNDGFSSYECGYGEAVWKDRWAPNHRYLYDLSIYGATFKGRMARRLQRGKVRDLATERARARVLKPDAPGRDQDIPAPHTQAS
ncbi:MAG TPA: GNAT family N-acetyltransferase [Acidimicrobiia bacterium]|nr:GNAT family N-acetyltransferase [Acidimicrobiia bacterium]